MERDFENSTFQSLLFLLIFVSTSFSNGQPDCAPPPFNCGEIKDISYSFWTVDHSHNCSHLGFELRCEDNTPQIKIGSRKYRVNKIVHEEKKLKVADMDFKGKKCPKPPINATVDFSLFEYATDDSNLILYYDCSPSNIPNSPSFPSLTIVYYIIKAGPLHVPERFRSCKVSVIPLPESVARSLKDVLSTYGDAWNKVFDLKWTVDLPKCTDCVRSGGNCSYSSTNPTEPIRNCESQPNHATCTKDNEKRRKIRKIIIGVGAGVGGCILTCFLFFICHRYRQRRFATASKLLSRSFSSDPSSQSELGKGGSILPTHIFTYKELEDATNNFDPSKELGDGGFGTVYHGKLRDGRSVAVKRLYENNCRRVEQFMNEIDILSRLRHQSLVTLYGCTSRHSRELLLVYEFIPNGTVADHLHGNHAKDGALTWPIRMSIAIESADALAYLHAVEIIHRDVKTNNILLDNNFNVKVADFGLSRLFPTDRTHVSTAPQGTPGYVDPDYHRCYQLNNKSDVYSFGVVLIELISSKPAVDITRHRQEINLANMAINKIHNNALNELVDPTLGYESDHAVRRMITLVAELAFRCLQDEKEVRPTMQEVLEVLKGIQREDYKVEKAEELDVLAVADDAVLLKKFRPLSPDSVTDTWISRSTTPSASG
ncbi:LEAF RUST 10 DISEASE-RESISTANCE LOCUS RECEPTOR-LIKE PROTEIN KINASE-like 1.2 isoform X3 [Magnolia sinica]|uniref:LEAF RUST 10 DISEASE-RESISTANCE LOCUS RECEPTOR-LIKE PROTEIN KINASE-like 1.2 isoform X3 n=1 Tax=Magnolia sinica TaxID=86752 RepID=UPI0026583779|nr:LEAF RUST 10 DISEASE-RESISTANCE LOCUS RECEPTOR-LIKE PROTEIN KINASE-like 1.2 isoform X3 [Magnolia sinica]